jgi:hypothetical protein
MQCVKRSKTCSAHHLRRGNRRLLSLDSKKTSKLREDRFIWPQFPRSAARSVSVSISHYILLLASGNLQRVSAVSRLHFSCMYSFAHFSYVVTFIMVYNQSSYSLVVLLLMKYQFYLLTSLVTYVIISQLLTYRHMA